MDPWVEESLVCPVDRSPVRRYGETLVCVQDHRYPCIDDIPVMLPPDEAAAQPWVDTFATKSSSPSAPGSSEVDAFVQEAIQATNGNMYQSLIGKLPRYPIPNLPLPEGEGRRFLDVGCNWGRWSVSAAKKGYSVVGIDPSLKAIQAASRVARQLGVQANYVVADATRLPFADATFDVAHSYGVLQHLDKLLAESSLIEVARTLRKDGQSVVQLANLFGVRSLINRARRAFRSKSPFETNYYTPRELRRLFGEAIGPTFLSVDGYLSLNAQEADVDLLPLRYQWLVRGSTALRRLSAHFPPMLYFADSLYVTSTRRSSEPASKL